MAGMDWLTTLGVADQSLESQLARRDLSKKAALVQNLAKMTEDKRSQMAEEDLKRQALEESRMIKQATLDQTAEYRKLLQHDREETEGRNKYNTVADNLSRSVNRGETPQVDESTAGMLSKFEGPGAITTRQVGGEVPQEGSGEGTGQLEYLYRQHEAEVAAAKAKLDEAIRKKNEERAVRDQSIQERDVVLREKAAQRQEKEEGRREARETDRVKAVAEKRKQLEENLKKLPPQMAPAVKARAEQIINDNSSVWDSLPWADKEDSVTDAWVQAYNETVAKVHPGVVKGAPGGPGAAIPPGGRGSGGAETPEQRIQRLLNEK